MKQIEIDFKSETRNNGYKGNYEDYQGKSLLMIFHEVTRGMGYSKTLLSRAFTRLVPPEEWKGMRRSEVIQHCYKFTDVKYR